jgi:hypothetical protein
MKQEVSTAIEELKRNFPSSTITTTEDGSGGVYVFIEPIDVGPRYSPRLTWLGAQIPALYPYADIYPVFMGHDVQRVDGITFVAPVTNGASFAGRPAIQISRRNNLAQQFPQPAFAKFVKVLNYLETLP